jgi:hypothetical protein
MDTDKIQERIDATAKGMAAKALPQPSAEFSLRANQEPQLMLRWKTDDTWSGYHFITGAIETILAEADAYVADLPSPEEAKMTAFMSALGKVVDLGKQNDIDVEFVNSLVALMKRLSKNALQHKPMETA